MQRNNLECSGGNYCCSFTFRKSWVGYFCLGDCNGGSENERCCDSKCQKRDSRLASWIIVLIALSVFGLVATVVGVELYYLKMRRPMCISMHFRQRPGFLFKCKLGCRISCCSKVALLPTMFQVLIFIVSGANGLIMAPKTIH